MRILMIGRATLYSVPGGDTVQIVQTARELNHIGVSVDVILTHQKVKYVKYDLVHFFNITRPADILYHLKKISVPIIVTPILINYSEFDKFYRNGIAGKVFRLLSPDSIEYVKSVGRWLRGRDKLMSLSYLFLGQRASVKKILNKANWLLPNSKSEYNRLVAMYNIRANYTIVPNGIDVALFEKGKNIDKDIRMVICAARIEGIKNQYNLIKALNNKPYHLFLIGSAAPNQEDYYNRCKTIAKSNITFTGHLPQQELIKYYQLAKVHVLPSWFETTGLSSLEAAAMGCNIVITDKGDAKEYFGNDAFYCDPASTQSIFNAIEKAAQSEYPHSLHDKIIHQYTWQQAAIKTKEAYEQVIVNSSAD